MYNQKQPPKPASLCLTPACVLAAAELIENMSPRAHELDPCTSFDKFVCEGWQEKHDLRADQGGAFTGTIMAENSQTLLRHILESPYPSDHEDYTFHSTVDEDNFNMLKDDYNACMDEEKIKKAGAQPLIDILRKVEELFPAMRPHEATSPFPVLLNQEQKGLTYLGENQLSEVVVFLMRTGVAPLIAFNIDVSLICWVPFVDVEPVVPSTTRCQTFCEEMIKCNGDKWGSCIPKLLDDIQSSGVLRSDCRSI